MNKYLIIGIVLAILSALTYHFVTVSNLKDLVIKKDKEIVRLVKANEILKGNENVLDGVVLKLKNQNIYLQAVVDDITVKAEKAGIVYRKMIQVKNKEIVKLKKLIGSMPDVLTDKQLKDCNVIILDDPTGTTSGLSKIGQIKDRK